MATPTEAEIQTQISNAVKILEETRKYGQTNAQNWVALEDVLIQSLESDFAGQVLSQVGSMRGNLSSILSAAPSLLEPLFRTYAKFMQVPETDAQGIFDRLYKRFVDNTLRVTSRQYTYGTPTAAAGNAGNGVILRNTKDEENFDIENETPDAKSAVCIADHNTGAEKHEEVFEIRGQDRSFDELERRGRGSGLKAIVRAVSARNSLLINPSFSQGTITTTGGDITGWTSNVAVNSTNYAFDTTNFYRGFPGDVAPQALQINVSAVLTQKLSVRNLSIDPKRPHFLQVAYNRQVGAAGGTLVIRMGAQSTSISVSTQTGWNLARVPSTFPSSAAWYKNFDEQDLDIAIEWTRTAGNILVDDVVFVPMEKFGGTYYVVVGGSTPFLKGDTFTWSDTAVGSVLQEWFHRAFERYLPSATGLAVTWPDP